MNSLKIGLLESIEKIVNLVYPSVCSFCGESTKKTTICPLCKRIYCDITPQISIKGGTLSKIISPYQYSNEISFTIFDLKYNNIYKPACELANVGFSALIEQNLIPNFDYIIPIPIHWIRKYRRGYNQAKLLADELSTLMNIPILDTAIKRVKYGKSQTKKSREKRISSLMKTFKLNNSKDIKDKTIILVDDVATTGTTALMCSNILKVAGAKEIILISLAKT